MHAPQSLPHPSPHRLRPRGSGPDRETHVSDLGRLWVGLVVLSLGTPFLLDAAGVLNADRAIDLSQAPVKCREVERSARRDALPADEGAQVNATAVFGGVAIKHEP